MSVSEELKKLAELHESGVLSDEEFEQAKDRLLNGGTSDSPDDQAVPDSSGEASDESSIDPVAAKEAKAKKIKLGVLIGLVVILVSIGIYFVVTPSEEELIQKARLDGSCFSILNEVKTAAEVCGAAEGVTYEKDPERAVKAGARVLKLSVDGKGKEDYRGAKARVGPCIMNLLGASETVKSRFERTSAIQGVLSESWTVDEGPLSYEVKAKWFYHPDPGLSLDIEVAVDALHSPQCDDYMGR